MQGTAKNVMIELDRVSKKFIMIKESRPAHNASFLKRVMPHRDSKEEFWALRDVSFAVKEGESVGILGPNGSGKSTILKLIANILKPTQGRVTTRGRVAALLELGAGFHGDLSGRDNIYLNGSVLGMQRKEIDRVFDEIVDFAELDRFIDMQVKYYSSGMYLRLGFAIAVHVQPEILIIDETLAVGDQAFQAKCITRIRDIKKRGTTVMLVSHSTDSVHDLCGRALWMERGVLKCDGLVDDVIAEYMGAVIKKEREDMQAAETQPVQSSEQAAQDRWGSHDVEITGVEFLAAGGRPSQDFQTDRPLTARIHYHAQRPLKRPVFGVAIYSANGVHINGPNTEFSGLYIDLVDGDGYVDYTIPALPLLGGNYLFSAAIYDRELVHAYDHHHMRYRFTVLPDGVKERYGILSIPSTWTHQRLNGVNGHG